MSWGMSRTRARLRPSSEHGHNGPEHGKENTMAKYLLLKHYRGAPAAVNNVPMDQWKPDEVEAHIQFMNDFAAKLERDGEFAETKDLIAGWMVIDVDTYERALELAGELSAAPGANGEPIHEWLEVR